MKGCRGGEQEAIRKRTVKGCRGGEQEAIRKMLNCSFIPLTFPKLRFWPHRKKLQNSPLSFCNCSSFGPPRQKKTKKNVAPHLGCHVSVDRVNINFGGQNCHRCKT